MCGPKKARSHFPRERMVLASFGFLGVSARPPRTKNWVLVISMLWNCLCSCANVSDCVCGMVMLSMMIGGMLRCCFVVVVLVFVVGVVVGGGGGCCCVGVCGGDVCGGGGVCVCVCCG